MCLSQLFILFSLCSLPLPGNTPPTLRWSFTQHCYLQLITLLSQGTQICINGSLGRQFCSKGCLEMSRDIFSYYNLGAMLLASSREKRGVLLNTMRCPERSPQTSAWFQISIGLTLRNLISNIYPQGPAMRVRSPRLLALTSVSCHLHQL